MSIFMVTKATVESFMHFFDWTNQLFTDINLRQTDRQINCVKRLICNVLLD